MYFLYSLLTALGMVILLPYFFLKGMRSGKYIHNVRERLGFLPADFPGNQTGRGAIWIHAVSVGEALAALPLARRLKERCPERKLYVSTTTATGQALVRERMGFADGFLYFPLDWAGPIRRVIRAVQPGLVVVLETEIWPNFLRECRRAGVPVAFVNGRISERSFRRYRLLDGFLARVLRDADLYLMQSETDAMRLGELGAPPERVLLGGNMKYDLAAPVENALVTWLEKEVEEKQRRPLVVAGSVAAGEEEAVLAAFARVRSKWPQALMVLAPRKPERFDACAALLEKAGWQAARRSRLGPVSALKPETEVVLLDSVGELAALYRLADTVFVGGSLVPAGGHNILEPAWWGKPPVFGPHMQNFAEMAAQFVGAQGGLVVGDAQALGAAWESLLGNAELRARMGAEARRIVDANRGATDAALGRLAALLEAKRSPA